MPDQNPAPLTVGEMQSFANRLLEILDDPHRRARFVAFLAQHDDFDQLVGRLTDRLFDVRRERSSLNRPLRPADSSRRDASKEASLGRPLKNKS